MSTLIGFPIKVRSLKIFWNSCIFIKILFAVYGIGYSENNFSSYLLG